MTSSTQSRGVAMKALLSLAIGSFGIGMTEFVSMGLLPGLAVDLLPGVYATSPEDAIAQAGTLISMYALGVVVGAPTIAGFVSRYPRHRVLVALVIALLVFNALTFLMPNFELVAASRFLSGLPHGAYFGISAIVASELFGPAKRGSAIAIVMGGLSVANLIGVPGGTLLGQMLGWRAAYVVVAFVFVVALVLIIRFVPAQPGDPGRTFRQELGIFRIPQVWLTVAIGGVGFGAYFAIYSYIATFVTEAAGSPEWVVPIALVVVGAGMVAGNFLGGALADISVRRTLIYGLFCLVVTGALVGLLSQHTVPLIIALFVFALTSATAVPTVQLRLLDVASGHRSIGAALNHSALNIGNSLGAALGGAVIATGWGYVAPAWVAAALALVGGAIALAAFSAERRATDRRLRALEPEFRDRTVGTDTIPTV
ncbi:MFS transporter [Microbacterium sp.]|uniref:MFS transporter n=1 Tax=Microbacterium sp. TaxID=51671 RepID=UPI003F9697D8